MAGERCRLLPFHVADGPWNMAADETMLDTASTTGLASLRFYGWSVPTLTLGYFQPARGATGRLAALPWVRRPTGGAALVHHHELTCALALPAGRVWQPPGESWICRMHGVLRKALAQLGVEAYLVGQEEQHGDVLCFLHHTPGDLLVAGRKIAGSAQRRQHGALLQHGGILLAGSPHTPELLGIADLTGVSLSPALLQQALVAAFVRNTGSVVEQGDWTEEERKQITDQASRRYSSPLWNERR